jgi:hypothetical protein
MMRYLLAAEADKIQDTIFRSVHLREVVGGSQLLNRFCETADRLIDGGGEIIVSDAGSFRVLLDDKTRAQEFGRQLAEIYRRLMGGTLTVAEPVACGADFAEASKKAMAELRQAKLSRRGAVGMQHIPFSAFCGSCGAGIATVHARRVDDQRGGYICNACLNQMHERAARGQGFVREFQKAVREFLMPDEPMLAEKVLAMEIPTQENLAALDAHGDIAYLVTDGNEMGRLFSACRDKNVLCALSKGLKQSMRRSLAQPTACLVKHYASLAGKVTANEDKQAWLPVLPLILGGDDCCAMLPAQFAIDFARKFCRNFQVQMQDLCSKLGLDEPVSMAAAVVVCKGKYPHRTAYERAALLLKDAKLLSRLIAHQQPGKELSALNFDKIIGNEVNNLVEDRTRYRPSLKPYIIAGQAPHPVTRLEIDDPLGRYGLLLDDLFKARQSLGALPNKRLQELRELFGRSGEIKPTGSYTMEAWLKELDYLLDRLQIVSEQRGDLMDALSRLGNASYRGRRDENPWRFVERGEEYYAHGLPDLIEVWD